MTPKGHSLHDALDFLAATGTNRARKTFALCHIRGTSEYLTVDIADPKQMTELETEPDIFPLVHFDGHDRHTLKRLLVDSNIEAVLHQHAVEYQTRFFDHSALEWITSISLLALSSALDVLAETANQQTEDILTMPLTGSLQKCIHYAGILLTQHGYDHVSIYFSPNSKQYDVFTDAEVERRSALNTMADRELVMRVTVYQLKQILEQQQLTLGLDNAIPSGQETHQTRQLPSRSNSSGYDRSDATPEGRHRDDSTTQEQLSDLDEPLAPRED